MLAEVTVKANKSGYKKCGSNPTLLHGARCIEKINEKRQIMT